MTTQTPFQPVYTPPVQEFPPPPPQQPPPTGKRPWWRSAWAIIGLVLLLVGGGVIAALLLLGGDQTAKPSSGQPSASSEPPAPSPTTPAQQVEPEYTLYMTTFSTGTGEFQTGSYADFTIKAANGTLQITGKTPGMLYHSGIGIPTHEIVTLTATAVPAGSLSSGSGPGLVVFQTNGVGYYFVVSTKYGAEIKRFTEEDPQVVTLASLELPSGYPGKGTLTLIVESTTAGNMLTGYLNGAQVVKVVVHEGISEVAGGGVALSADMANQTVAFDYFLVQGGAQPPKD